MNADRFKDLSARHLSKCEAVLNILFGAWQKELPPNLSKPYLFHAGFFFGPGWHFPGDEVRKEREHGIKSTTTSVPTKSFYHSSLYFNA